MNENLANRALEVLNRDQDQLKGAYEKQSDYDAPDKIEKVTVTENSDGTWSQNKELVESGFKDGGVIGEREAEIEEEAEILQEFCAEIDNKIIGILTQIDDKKREIVTLSITAGITSTGGVNFCNSSLGVGIVTLFDINEDTETVKIYTKMAGPNVDYGTENPFEPDTTISLSGVTTHYAGFGYENVAESSVYKNSAGSVTGLKTDGSGPGISTNGRPYAFESSSNLISGQTSAFTAAVDTGFSGIATNPTGIKQINLGVSFTAGMSVPEINKGSGEVIYLDNRASIARNARQKEDIKVILEF